MPKVIRTNKYVSLTLSAMLLVCMMVSNGTLLQTFLFTLGFSPKLVYFRNSLVQITNVLILLSCANKSTSGNIIRKYAISCLPNAILMICYLPFCFIPSANSISFILLALIGISQAVISALRTNYSYILPYQLYPAEDYGFINAISGIMSSVISLLIGYVFFRLTRSISYTTLMAGAFLVVAIIEFICYKRNKY